MFFQTRNTALFMSDIVKKTETETMIAIFFIKNYRNRSTLKIQEP